MQQSGKAETLNKIQNINKKSKFKQKRQDSQETWDSQENVVILIKKKELIYQNIESRQNVGTVRKKSVFKNRNRQLF